MNAKDTKIIAQTTELIDGFNALLKQADALAKSTWGHRLSEVEDAGCTFNYCIELAGEQASRIAQAFLDESAANIAANIKSIQDAMRTS